MSDDRVIQFPGAVKHEPKPTEKQAAPAPEMPWRRAQTIGARSEQAGRALAFLSDYARGNGLTGLVVIGIRPTTTGADFLTEVIGEEADLRNARYELAGVIERAYVRKGITR